MGRFNWDWRGEGPPDEAYSRVTEPERFKPLHDWALEAVERLQTEYEVILEEGTGIDAELEAAIRPCEVHPCEADNEADTASGILCAHHDCIHRLSRS